MYKFKTDNTGNKKVSPVHLHVLKLVGIKLKGDGGGGGGGGVYWLSNVIKMMSWSLTCTRKSETIEVNVYTTWPKKKRPLGLCIKSEHCSDHLIS